MTRRILRRIAAGALASLLLFTAAGCGGKKEAAVFRPRLDTKANFELRVLGFFGNFEALDQITNDFNNYYPQITFSYQQVGSTNATLYLDANPGVDIFMTSAAQLNQPDSKVRTRCVDLSKEDIDLGDIDGEMLKLYNYSGFQAAIPMGQDVYGLIVNNTLLEKEGLAVPTNTEEFLSTLAALKAKGYNPIQGPTQKIAAELTRNYAFSRLCRDPKLLEAAKAGSDAAVQALKPAFDFLTALWDTGYVDPAVNDSLPKENYDASILSFYEGNVPFWVCDTEKVSGMKKRESKSEAFQSAPFTYSFIYTPLGEPGTTAFQSPWFGFSVNQDADHRKYALEFIRFLAQREEINKMADIKGIPSVAKEHTDSAVYKSILSPEAMQQRSVNTGAVTTAMEERWYAVTADFVAGGYDSAESAIRDFLTSVQ